MQLLSLSVSSVPVALCKPCSTWLTLAAQCCASGVSYDHAEYFDQVDDAQVMKLIAVNIVAITKVRSHPALTVYWGAGASAV